MKSKRQERILEIIAEHNVETQEELLARLEQSGFHCTQSTVSRDMKQLHLVKELSDDRKTYRYTVSRKRGDPDSVNRMQKILQECCLRCDHAQNLVVVKTMPGLASAAGAAIDLTPPEGMVGCICGDDTVLIVMREQSSAQALCREIEALCK